MEKIEIQLPIEGIPYAYAKYYIQDGEQEKVIQEHNSLTSILKNNLTPQDIEEEKLAKDILEKVQIQSEMKSALIDKLKEEIGEEKYNEIKDKVLTSDDFKSITKHL